MKLRNFKFTIEQRRNCIFFINSEILNFGEMKRKYKNCLIDTIFYIYNEQIKIKLKEV
jgi:hypothetical protein